MSTHDAPSPSQASTLHRQSPPQELEGLSEQQRAVIKEEEEALSKVMRSLGERALSYEAPRDLDKELLALREQLQEAHLEDQAALLTQMEGIQALSSHYQGRDDEQEEADFISAPYFGRIIFELYDDEGELTGKRREFFIGRRSFVSQDGRVKVIDWRTSPMSRLYYLYQEGDEFFESIGDQELDARLSRRRTVSIKEGVLRRVQYGASGERTLTRVIGEGWSNITRRRAQLHGGQGVATRPDTGKVHTSAESLLPEITAMIDPEQFSLITHEQSGVVIIQGGAGTGKTTIALHRVAYLHFQNPTRFTPERMLMLTPGVALKRYVSQVLPSLDVPNVPIYTFSEWAFTLVKELCPRLKHHRLLEHTDINLQTLKRSTLMTQLLERAVREEGRELEARFEQAGGARLKEAWVKRRELPLMERLKRLKRFVAEQGASLPLKSSQAIERAMRDYADPFGTWLDLFTQTERLERWLRDLGARPSERLLTRLREVIHLQSLSRERGGEREGEHNLRCTLDPDDCALMLRLAQLKYGALKGPSGKRFKYEHVMVDEAQDLSPVALQVLCGATPQGAPVTLAGDTAQRVIFDNGFSRWSEVLPYLPKSAKLLPPLKVSYRSTRQIMELARHILGDLAHDWSSREPRDGPEVTLSHFETQGEASATLSDALKRLAQSEPQATVAVVTRTPAEARQTFEALTRFKLPQLRLIVDQEFTFTAGVDLTDIMQIKGLEYDYVVALNVNEERYPHDNASRHLLHILATRAAHQLWIINAGERAPSPLLPELSAP